ncbi:hypothetical protein H7X87_03735 [Acetobacteraceae bacterium]|nr:hypothetical protein [Candidatus Parcubacteria bacterium]
MIYGIVLGLHITAAIVTLGVIAYALNALLQKHVPAYKNAARAVAFLAIFEVLSGTLLVGLSHIGFTSHFLIHIAAYLLVCAATELLLIERMRRAVWVS